MSFTEIFIRENRRARKQSFHVPRISRFGRMTRQREMIDNCMTFGQM